MGGYSQLDVAGLCCLALLAATACGSSDSELEPECGSEPTIRTTPEGVEYVRTPDACFENLPDWSYAAKYVEIDGLRQAYIDEGDPDGEVVLLLHGNPTWSYLYRKVIPVLTEAGFRVVAMDLLGMGRSDKPVDIGYHSYVRHGDRLTRFIEALDLREITLFAHDWGSLIGLRVAALNLDRFARISLGSGNLPEVPTGAPVFPPPVEDPDEVSEILSPYDGIPDQQVSFFTSEDQCALIEPYDFTPWFIGWQTWSMKGASYSVSHVLESLTWFDLPAAEEAAYEAPFPSRMYMAGPRTFPSLVVAEAGDTQQAWALLSDFDGPFLTIWGDNDHLDIGACSVQDNFICRVPGAAGQPHARIPEASHYLPDDQGAQLGQRLVSFIRGDGTFAASYSVECEAGGGGVGTMCTSDSDCTALEGGVCLVFGAAGGICSVEGCTAGSCGEGAACCRDCNPDVAAMLPFDESACFPEAAVSMVTMSIGCTCD
ncbi:MAG: haloalkane dehalogenase [Myxococcota bacterium]